MAFVRYTEFYESKYDWIRDSRFTLVEQMSAYCREYLKDEDATWSYTSDFSGFNFPADVIKHVHQLGIPDPNHYDSLMLGIYGLMHARAQGKPAYIIGTCSGDDATLDHEMTHAMWYIDDEYREIALKAINACSQELRDSVVNALAEQNYPAKVAFDELNAYVTTGEAGFFDGVKQQEELDSLRASLRKLHRERFKKFCEPDE